MPQLRPGQIQPGAWTAVIGAGSGFDSLFAARMVGLTECAVGVDMTPEILA